MSKDARHVLRCANYDMAELPLAMLLRQQGNDHIAHRCTYHGFARAQVMEGPAVYALHLQARGQAVILS